MLLDMRVGRYYPHKAPSFTVLGCRSAPRAAAPPQRVQVPAPDPPSLPTMLERARFECPAAMRPPPADADSPVVFGAGAGAGSGAGAAAAAASPFFGRNAAMESVFAPVGTHPSAPASGPASGSGPPPRLQPPGLPSWPPPHSWMPAAASFSDTASKDAHRFGSSLPPPAVTAPPGAPPPAATPTLPDRLPPVCAFLGPSGGDAGDVTGCVPLPVQDDVARTFTTPDWSAVSSLLDVLRVARGEPPGRYGQRSPSPTSLSMLPPPRRESSPPAAAAPPPPPPPHLLRACLSADDRDVDVDVDVDEDVGTGSW